MRRFLFTATIVTLCFCNLSCGKVVDDNRDTEFEKGVPVSLTKSQQQILKAGQDFNFELLRKAFDGEKTVFISPLSLQAAMSMVANGAAGETFSEIVDAIGYKGCSIDEVNSMYCALVGGLAGVDKSVTFDIANALWVNRGFPVKNSFVNTLRVNYSAGCENLDFSEMSTVDKINRWCSDNTHGMIKGMLDGPIDPSLMTLITNALYFKGTWTNGFEARYTRQEPFYDIAGGQSKVDMMKQQSVFLYGETDDAQVCVLPFGNKSYSLDIVLPSKGADFNKFVSGLDASGWDSLFGTASECAVDLSVPKLDIEFMTSFVEILNNMGMNRAFTSSAQFDYLSDVSTCIGKISQKAVFKMDEKGAEAAAVTIVGNCVTSVGPAIWPHEFKADRPFVFAIRESSSGAVLFIGAYTGK